MNCHSIIPWPKTKSNFMSKLSTLLLKTMHYAQGVINLKEKQVFYQLDQLAYCPKLDELNHPSSISTNTCSGTMKEMPVPVTLIQKAMFLLLKFYWKWAQISSKLSLSLLFSILLFLYVCFCLSPSVCMSVSICLPVCLSVSLSVYLCGWLYPSPFYPSLSLSLIHRLHTNIHIYYKPD